MTVSSAGRVGRRDRIMDLVVVALSALAATAFAAEAWQSGRLTGRALILSVGVALVGCAALWWRRQHVLAVALALAPLATFTELLAVATLVAVYTVATYRRLAVALVIAGVHMLANVPYWLVRPDPELTASTGLALEFGLLAVALAVGVSVRTRRETVAALRERAARAEREANLNAERLRSLERTRLAREMHDVLAHRMALVSLHAGALEVRSDLSGEEVASAALIIRANAREALEDLRQILGVLREGGKVDDLRPQPELAEVDTLVAGCRADGAAVEVDNRLTDGLPPSAVSRTAYRIVQEGLTNANKHAPGLPVHILIERTTAGELHVRLRNPLLRRGGPATPGTRSGLLGLAERVSLAGGRIEHGIRHGADGTLAFHVEAWLPWPK